MKKSLVLGLVISLSACAGSRAKNSLPEGVMLTTRSQNDVATCIALAVTGSPSYSIDGNDKIVISNQSIDPTHYIVSGTKRKQSSVYRTEVTSNSRFSHPNELENIEICLPDPIALEVNKVDRTFTKENFPK